MSAADAIRRIREEMARGDYYTALGSIRALEAASAPAAPSSPTSRAPAPTLNATQRLRLCLMKADCHSTMSAHGRALEVAKLAIEMSHTLSPQASFIAGRECYKLGQLREALEHFEAGEMLISSGAGVADGAPVWDMDDEGSDSAAHEKRRRAAWAAIGEDPRSAPPGMPPANASPSSSSSSSDLAPLVPSFEWAQDLEKWRQFHKEAKVLRVMVETHVVPSMLLNQAVEFASRQGGTRSHGVIVIRNATEVPMRFQHQVLEGCEFAGELTFANTIRPGEACVAVVCYTGWASGGRVSVAYSHESGTAAAFVLDAPLMSDYTAGTNMRPDKGRRQMSELLSEVKLKPRPTTSEIVSVGSGAAKQQFKSIVALVGRVTHFSLVEVRAQTLTDAELISVLEFLPAPALRQAAAVSWHVRECVSRLPPTNFFTAPVSAASSEGMHWYPNYLFAADTLKNPWIVHDTQEVHWRMIFEGVADELEEYCIVDTSDNRILTVGLELQGSSRSFNAVVHYGGGRRRQLVSKIQENWNPFSKSTTWRMNNGRKLGSVNVGTNEVTVVAEAGLADTPIITMSKQSTTSVDPSYLVTAKGNAAGAATLQFFGQHGGGKSVAVLQFSRRLVLSKTRRGDVVAELVLHKGCDAFLTSVLSVFGRVKWAATN